MEEMKTQTVSNTHSLGRATWSVFIWEHKKAKTCKWRQKSENPCFNRYILNKIGF